MRTPTPPIAIGAECPEPECDWFSCNPHSEPAVFAHLVEMHGHVDTTAHVLAYDAATQRAN